MTKGTKEIQDPKARPELPEHKGYRGPREKVPIYLFVTQRMTQEEVLVLFQHQEVITWPLLKKMLT